MIWIMQRIGIFGGTFDPLHNAHLILAQEALESGGLDRLLVVPAWQSPHKGDRPGMRDELRLELLQQHLGTLPSVEILDLEIRLGRSSFTFETLRALRIQHPEDLLVFLLGSDSLHELHTWKNPEELASLAHFLVAPRPGFQPEALPGPVTQIPGLEFEVMASTEVAISSTLIRERVASGLGLRGFVPEAVENAILKTRCYA